MEILGTIVCEHNGLRILIHSAPVIDLVRAKNSSEARCPLMPPPDGNNAIVRPVARGIEQARRGGCSYPEGTAAHCPSPDDSVRHGNVRHNRLRLAAGSARQRGSLWTSTPLSQT